MKNQWSRSFFISRSRSRWKGSHTSTQGRGVEGSIKKRAATVKKSQAIFDRKFRNFFEKIFEKSQISGYFLKTFKKFFKKFFEIFQKIPRGLGFFPKFSEKNFQKFCKFLVLKTQQVRPNRKWPKIFWSLLLAFLSFWPLNSQTSHRSPVKINRLYQSTVRGFRSRRRNFSFEKFLLR